MERFRIEVEKQKKITLYKPNAITHLPQLFAIADTAEAVNISTSEVYANDTYTTTLISSNLLFANDAYTIIS